MITGHVRERMRFTGCVQGVGFRALCRRLAHDLPITGWVRNEPDGSVYLEAEGSAEHVEALVDAIRAARAESIHEVARESMPVRGEERDFSIRY